MSIAGGTRLGPYEVIAPAGAGGMGEVYKARDTRLDRIVAVKVLPSHVAESTEARQRFDREARAISSLNHPNICTLFDVGHQDGIDFLVMEYLEGETLASRLTRGPLPLAEALNLAIQIADALQKAHRQDLVHRDLKPGNIMLTKAGAKLLDFGLAKLQQTGGTVAEPAMTHSAPLTGEGTILGTLQYMPPEQLEGKKVDHRSDLFAFGAILYEMASGHRAFEGGSQASLIAAILKEQPRPLREWQALSPPALERTVAQCLAKDPDDRWQSAGDLKRELEWIRKEQSLGGETRAAAHSSAPRSGRWKALWGASVLAALLLAGALWIRFGGPPHPVQGVSRFIIATDSLESTFATAPAISPDGRLIAYTDAGKLQLRELSQFKAETIGESKDLGGLFWSPDSRTLAFGQEERLWRFDVATREKRLIGNLPETGRILGGCWNEAGDIYLAVWRGSLYHTSEKGGAPTLVVPSDSVLVHDFHTPQFLPDGRTVLLFMHAKKAADNSIVLLKHGSKELTAIRKVPLSDGVTYSPSGHLLYTVASDEGEVWALPFSASDTRVTGEPFLAVHGAQCPSVSQDGIMVCFSTSKAREFRLIMVSRDGKQVDSVGAPAGNMSTPVFSPDGRSLLCTAEDKGVWTLWKHDLARRTSEPLIVDSSLAIRPSWFPSGDRFIYSRILGVSQGTINVFDLSSGTVTDSICEGMYGSLSRDGRHVVFSRDVQGNFDLWWMDLDAKTPPASLLRSAAREEDAAISPSGTWFAYGSNASGEAQIYLRTFPEARSPLQVSVNGGWYPFWHPSGDTLFWVTDSAVYQSSIDWAPTPRLGMPTVALDAVKLGLKLNSRYSAAGENAVGLSPDGTRFAAVMRAGAADGKSQLWVVLNWFSELEELH
jgi:Tol biopolymer transport system component